MKLLVEKGASIDNKDGKGKTGAMLARENNYDEVAGFLEKVVAPIGGVQVNVLN